MSQSTHRPIDRAMDWTGKKVVVVGLGATGRATARFLKHRGADVCVTDAARISELQEAADEMARLGVRIELGGHRPETFSAADMIVISPGVPHTMPALQRAKAPLIGEIELASRMVSAPIVAVTGTNGKTTTTTLIGQMLSCSGKAPFVGGNIGDPLIGYVDRGQGADVVVLEVSSFQLDTAETFHPKVAVLLNIAEDHLDRYPDMAAYAASKERIFRNQGPEDTAVLNAGDRWIRQAADRIAARRLVFGWDPDLLGPDAQGALLALDRLHIRTRNTGPIEIPLAGFRPQGGHNVENAAAAALAALAAGATVDGIARALEAFSALPHRLELVGRVADVSFYDDSKATNVDAVVRALETFSVPVVLILGGRDKRGDLAPLAQAMAGRVKEAVLIGEAADRFHRFLSPGFPLVRASSMNEAVSAAFRSAGKGGTVLLSPACSSFDWYKSYAQRGEDFRRAVEELKDRVKDA